MTARRPPRVRACGLHAVGRSRSSSDPIACRIRRRSSPSVSFSASSRAPSLCSDASSRLAPQSGRRAPSPSRARASESVRAAEPRASEPRVLLCHRRFMPSQRASARLGGGITRFEGWHYGRRPAPDSPRPIDPCSRNAPRNARGARGFWSSRAPASERCDACVRIDKSAGPSRVLEHARTLYLCTPVRKFGTRRRAPTLC